MPKEKADLIISNATIYTIDNDFSTAESMVIRQGKIIATGDYRLLKEKYLCENEWDAKEKFIYPGFYDAHCHFYGYGINKLTSADLVGTHSFNEVIDRLQTHFKQHPSQWLMGRGWDQNDWEDKSFPNKTKLDELFPDNPVFLRRIDGHAAIANSKALELANITKETFIKGGKFIKENGELSGVLIDNAMEFIFDILPEASQQEVITSLQLAEKDCFAVGLTSVADAGLDLSIVKTIDSLQKANKLKMKIYAMLSPTDENIEYFVKKGIYLTPSLSVRSIKLYADGALGSRGAKLIQAYTDKPSTNGLLLHEESYFRKFCKLAYQNDYQINTHAIGDSANRILLNIYGEYLKGTNDKRWRIEHAQVIDKKDFPLFKKYSIVPSIQPTHATSDMYWADERLGAERIKNAYAYQQLLIQNGYVALGTDFPIEQINPLYTFFAAVFRKDLQHYPKGGFQPENALSRKEALKGMTIWAAKAAFEEKEKGSLENGKSADFVILSKDIMTCQEGELPNVQVLATFVNGELVYESVVDNN